MSDSSELCRLKASRRKLRVSVTDGRGRTRRAGGLSGWLCQVAPSAATGLVVVALVWLELEGDGKVRASSEHGGRVEGGVIEEHVIRHLESDPGDRASPVCQNDSP